MAIDIARQSFNLILGFGLSIPVFFVTYNAWVMWIVVPLGYRGGVTSTAAGATARAA